MSTFLDDSTHPKLISHAWAVVVWVVACLTHLKTAVLVEEARLLAMEEVVLEALVEVERLGLGPPGHLGVEGSGSASHHHRLCDTTIAAR
jgi:hypothetical protein